MPTYCINRTCYPRHAGPTKVEKPSCPLVPQLGAGYGAYLSVDAALTAQVLPPAADRARDLGVINIANSAPQVLGPVLAAPLVAHLGGYPTLYAATATVTLLGSILVFKIRSVP